MQDDAKLEEKRTISLFGAFLTLVNIGDINSSKFTLNRSLLKLTIRHYIKDLRILKDRYGIEDKVLPQKAAGLITAAIMRFKPVLPKNGSDESLFENDENEVLAAFNGLCMCMERSDGKVDLQATLNLWSKPEMQEWLANFLYLLKFREYTAESLVMVFDTLVRFAMSLRE
ncbi:MAG: hypothetical protein FWH22_10335 [Fibromonadales bacterium]|nr:hypothetical protein [Fibromonadales bacterium]